VWIGSHVIILPGVRIGRNSAIGAGSVLTKDVPDNCIAAGNPARLSRRI
jgi:maltose O-acetyltransferase